MKPGLDLTAFGNALASLGRAISRSLANPSDEEVRDAVIQRFEFSYELAWKTLVRYLEGEGVSEIAAFTKKELYREAAVRKLIKDPETWFAYQKARNETSHTYNAEKAAEVHGKAVAFASEAEVLYETLNRKIHD